MAKFRKKPVVIEAIKWDGTYEGIRIIRTEFPAINTLLLHTHNQEERAVYNGQEVGWCIGTLEGGHSVSKGDFVIKGIAGEFYPCKPDIFHQTYEVVD